MEVEVGADQTSAETETAGAESQTAAAPQIDIEARAFRMGWRPKDQYKGPEDKWIPPEQYIEIATESMPVLKKTLRTMDDKYGKMERQLAEMAEAFNGYREFATRAEIRAYEKARAELEAQRETAITQADVGAVKGVEAKLKELDEAKPEPPKKVVSAAETQGAVKLAPEVQTWIDANPWFNDDRQLKRAATSIDNDLREDEPTLTITARLAKVKAEVQRLHPEKFGRTVTTEDAGNARRAAPTAVGTSNGAPARQKNAHSFENLPPEAKKACDKQVKQMAHLKKPFTRDEYVSLYEWPE
jgi:hypothetical protein